MKNLFITILILIPIFLSAKDLQIGILKYKGGDWYSVKRAVKNFINEANSRSKLKINTDIQEIDLRDRNKLFACPFLILNGHGQIILDKVELENLKIFLEQGGFLFVNDDYGLEKAFNKLVKDLYPKGELVELSNEFPLFSSYYKFKVLPKIHEHDGKSPKAMGLFIEKRLTILYLNNSDIADGWEPASVHKDSEEVREKAIQFGINILYYVLTH